ncbi:TRAPP II complex [Desarmillaria tabescens]|uniref:TRAPP II complex n=1 Tax=Armillaria tabescens TaxID=1929756 RepID=A0AA39KEN7_ARMTA|nr:TRAPP II complex [Desarmillaria tabescens]KAK0459779.1 TRAPP II complex [Desarmillaria tabescens]
MDTHVFASLAHVQILLVPVGSISQPTFDKYVAEIRNFESIRLGDIPVDSKDERARFMPNPLSTGHLHLSFPTHPPPTSHIPLSLLRPSHFPLAVIGIASCAPDDTLPSVLAQFHGTLLDLFPADFVFPLARICFVFEEGDGNNSTNLGDSLPGLAVIPSMMGNKKIYLGTLIADLCSNVLGEFGVLVQALESPLGNEYLNSSLLPVLPPLSELPTPLNGNRIRDVLPPLSSHNSVPDMSKSGFTLASSPSMKRTSSAGHRQSTLTVPASKKRLSSIGAVSSPGRLFKVLGDFFTLAGRTEDAYVWYTESLQLFRATPDPVWQASALEGLATISILDSWSAGHGLQTSTSATTRDPWADVADKLTQATSLYYRTPIADMDHHSLVAYLYCCCVLRHSSLLFSVWSAKGWGPLAFTTMLQPGTTPYLPPTISYEDRNSWSHLERLSSISGISRISVASVIAQAHGPWLLHLDARERIGVLEAVAALYSCLGFRRKEAYILREVLGCILDLIVCGRDEDGIATASYSPDEGAQTSTTNATMSSAPGNPQVGVRVNESTEGNHSILKLLTHLCRVLGIELDAVKIVDADSTSVDANEPDDDFQLREPFGWPELQVGVVREAVAVAEALPDYLAVAQFALSSLKTLQDVLEVGDQYHFYKTATEALSTARRRGDTRPVEYWTGNPITSISVAPLPLIRLPNEKPLSALRPRSGEVNPILTGARNPFLYNPRQAAFGQPSQTMVVQNEVLEFVIELQNPYVFNLELDSLSLSTTGVPFESTPTRVLIPPESNYRVVVSGRATQSGTLTIRGCIVQAPAGAPREFVIPLATDDELERRARRHGALQCEMGRSKYSGLDAFPWEKALKRGNTQLARSPPRSIPRFLECKVVPEQPLLRIRRTSVTHGALMLYDGERSTIRLTVENVSSLPVDFLRLVFDDSTIAPAQQALAEGSLSTFDTYETEYNLIHRPLFSWNEDESRTIDPAGKLTLTVQCLGKVGCTSGTIHVTYACIQRNPESPSEVFHTRQLSYPLMVTVYHMLDCQAMDILPLPLHDDDSRPKKSQLPKSDIPDWCLFSIEVRNSYGTPFEVTIERVQQDAGFAKASSIIAPGSTSRLVIPLRKFLLTQPHVSQAIPTLSDRQFVLTESKLSDDEERTQTELFWYREELFKSLQCRWQEVGGTRSGDLSLRQQRMTLPMLNTLRTEAARIDMSLLTFDELEVPHRNDKYHPRANEFVHLHIKIKNQCGSPLTLSLDLVMEPSEHVIYEGVLNDIPVGQLEGGTSFDITIPLCFLAYGRFTIWAAANTFGGKARERVQGLAHLTAVLSEG